MNCDRDTKLVSGNKNAVFGKTRIENTAGQELAGSFSVAHANPLRETRDFIDVCASFLGHAELAFTDAGVHIFGGVADHGDFEIVNQRGTVHGHTGDEAAAHQIDENGAEAGLYNMPAHAPQDGLLLLFCAMKSSEEFPEILCGKNIGKRVEKFSDAGIAARGLGEIADADLAFAAVERIGVDT